MDGSNLDSLSSLPFFSTLSPDALDRLKAQSFVQRQPADTILFEQGQTAQFLHVILAGSVALVGSSTSHRHDGPSDDMSAARRLNPPSTDRDAIIEIVGAGDAVMIAAVLLDLPYLMSARLIAPTRLVYIPAQVIRGLLDTAPSFAKAMAIMLAMHWRLLSRQLKDQKLRSGTQRLGAYLLSLSDGRTSGSAELELPLDRRTLASWLGMSAENLSRSLAQLKSVGVQINGRFARIEDISRVRSFSLEDNLR